MSITAAEDFRPLNVIVIQIVLLALAVSSHDIHFRGCGKLASFFHIAISQKEGS
jgi:hypothetical protein